MVLFYPNSKPYTHAHIYSSTRTLTDVSNKHYNFHVHKHVYTLFSLHSAWAYAQTKHSRNGSLSPFPQGNPSEPTYFAAQQAAGSANEVPQQHHTTKGEPQQNPFPEQICIDWLSACPPLSKTSSLTRLHVCKYKVLQRHGRCAASTLGSTQHSHPLRPVELMTHDKNL